MRRWSVKPALVMSVVILVTLVLAAACSAGEFAADLTRTQKGKSEIGKVYVKGDKVREEVVVDGETGVTILRMDKRVSWVLMADNTYMEIALPVSVDPKESAELGEWVTLGTETVAGYNCEVKEFTYKKKSLGTLVQWTPRELGYAIKMETRNKGKVQQTTLLSNIKVQSLPDSLFEIPEGYSKFGLPFGIKLPGTK